MKVELIIFDCDGVLVDSEPIINRVFVEMLAELGYALDYEETVREFSGGSMATRMEVTQRRFEWSAPADFVSAFCERIALAIPRELRGVPGVRTALAALHGPRCVASNGSLDDIRVRLGAAGLLPYFGAHFFSAEEVEHGKPAPDVYLYAAARMGVDPSRCVVVEDSPTGVRGAVGAGMVTLGYARFTPARVLEEAGARVFEHMSELPGMLRTL